MRVIFLAEDKWVEGVRQGSLPGARPPTLRDPLEAGIEPSLSWGDRAEVSHPDEVVGRQGEVKDPFHARQAAEAHSAIVPMVFSQKSPQSVCASLA
jgi:hypothetical protein